MTQIVDTTAPPTRPARLVDDFAPPLILPGAHQLCAGCGEPAAIRSVVEMIDELGLTGRAVGVFAHLTRASYGDGVRPVRVGSFKPSAQGAADAPLPHPQADRRRNRNVDGHHRLLRQLSDDQGCVQLEPEGCGR